MTEHEQDLQRIRGFRLIDDDFMNACLDGDIPSVELMLRIILEQDIAVTRVETQKLIKNLYGRDIWLDIDAISYGTEYNIEIQRADAGAEPDRARAHSSFIDSHSLKPKDPFSSLPESYVIFITENDVIGGGCPIYHIEDTIREMRYKSFGDRRHIIYVNGADRNGQTELGRLMHDFFCTSADDMNYDILANRVRYFKESEEGRKRMCKVLEDMRKEKEQETKVIDIRNLMETMKWSIEQAMNALKIPADEQAMYAGLVKGK